MQLPSEPKTWQDIPPWCREVTRLLRAIYPRPSIDLLPTVGAGGTTSRVKSKAVNPAAIATFPDFSGYDAGGGYLGIDNGFLNWSAYAGGTSQLPTGMTAGAIRGSSSAFTIAVEGVGFAWIEVDCNTDADAAGDSSGGTIAGSVTSVTIETGDTVPTNEDGSYYLMLCGYSVNTSGSATSIAVSPGIQGIGSQNFLYCGGAGYFWGTN
jgi:hypothetical protein